MFVCVVVSFSLLSGSLCFIGLFGVGDFYIPAVSCLLQ